MSIDDLAVVVREGALAAGLTPEELDGPRRCFAGCGAVVTRVADTCAPCAARRVAEEHEAACMRAWHTAPPVLWWVALEHPQIRGWVRDVAARESALALVDELHSHPLVTFTGEAGAGKTTLACALLREWVSLGFGASSPRARSMARRVRFDTAQDLIRERTETRLGEHVIGIDLAREASVLALDEVGRGMDPHGVIFSLVSERHRAGRPTIITTPHLTAKDFAEKTRDGGLTRRVFDDAKVIEVRRIG